jgi:hypothetical protein
MKTRAAVAFEAGKPLEVVEVDLDGPKAGEVLVEIKATGICHTDEFTLSGCRSRGACSRPFWAMKGAGVVVETGPGVTSLKPGDHVIPLYTPECRECEYCLQSQDQPVSGDPVDPRSGRDAGWHVALFDARWHADPALHGLFDLFEPHGAAGNRACKDPRRTRHSTRFAISGVA